MIVAWKRKMRRQMLSNLIQLIIQCIFCMFQLQITQDGFVIYSCCSKCYFHFDLIIKKKRNIIIYLFIVLPLLRSTKFPKQLKYIFDLTAHEQISCNEKWHYFFIHLEYFVCVCVFHSFCSLFILFKRIR